MPIHFDNHTPCLEKVKWSEGLYFQPAIKNSVWNALLVMNDVIYLFHITVDPSYVMDGKDWADQISLIQQEWGGNVTIYDVLVVPDFLAHHFGHQRVEEGQKMAEWLIPLNDDFDLLPNLTSMELWNYCHLLGLSPPSNASPQDLIDLIHHTSLRAIK